jgi:hypothetical protein
MRAPLSRTQTTNKKHEHAYTHTRTHARAHTRAHPRPHCAHALPAHSGCRQTVLLGSVSRRRRCGAVAVHGVDGTDEVGGPTPPRAARQGLGHRSIARRSASPFPGGRRSRAHCALSAIDHARAYRRGYWQRLPVVPHGGGACARMRRRQANKHTKTHSGRPHELGCSACGSPAGRKENTQTAQSRAVARFMHARAPVNGCACSHVRTRFAHARNARIRAQTHARMHARAHEHTHARAHGSARACAHERMYAPARSGVRSLRHT